MKLVGVGPANTNSVEPGAGPVVGGALYTPALPPSIRRLLIAVSNDHDVTPSPILSDIVLTSKPGSPAARIGSASAQFACVSRRSCIFMKITPKR